MRIGRSRDCGELLMFEEVRRRLNLGMPQFESETTIAVADMADKPITGAAGPPR